MSMRPRRVVLVGPMGSGKSTVGRALAARLGVDHVDTDDLVEQHTALTIPQVFEAQGEAGFRARETEALTLAFAGSPKVISTGGGVVMGQRNRELLAGDAAFVVWLEADLDALISRVGDGEGRPLLAGDDVRRSLSARIAERAEAYADVADLRLDTTARTSDEVVDEIVAQLDLGVRT